MTGPSPWRTPEAACVAATLALDAGGLALVALGRPEAVTVAAVGSAALLGAALACCAFLRYRCVTECQRMEFEEYWRPKPEPGPETTVGLAGLPPDPEGEVE